MVMRYGCATTLCLKNVPTFKLAVTLSNLNRFSKFLHCWRAYEGWGLCSNFKCTHAAEKARDTTIDDEKASQHVTCVLVTALCNQLEAFAFRTSVTTSHV